MTAVLEIRGLSSGVSGKAEALASALKDLNATQAGTKVHIALSSDILFDFDKAVLRAEAGPALEKVLVVIQSYPGASVAIEGEVFEMGGGYIAEFEPRDRGDPRDAQLRAVAEMTGNTIPQRCLGPDVYGVWWAGETQPISA